MKKPRILVSIAILAWLCTGLSLSTAGAATPPCWSGQPDGLIGWSHSIEGVAIGLDVQGERAYVADFATPSLDEQTGILQIFDVSDPCNPVLKGSVNNPDAEITDIDVDLEGHYLYAAADTNGLVVYDVSDVDNPFKAGFIIVHPPWGAPTHLAYNGGDYLYAGHWYSEDAELAIYNVSNPLAPSLVSTYSDPQYNRHSHGLDVVGDRAYHILTNGTAHLEIVDVSNRLSPLLKGSKPYEPKDYGDIGHVKAHGDYLFISSGYWAGGDIAGGLRVFDISDETNPQFVTRVDIPDAGVLHWHLADLKAVGNRLYMTSQTGLYVFDISDPTHPTILIDPNVQTAFKFPTAFGNCEGGLVEIRGHLAYVTALPKDFYNDHGGLAIYKLYDPDKAGPVVTDVLATPNPVLVGKELSLTALVDDTTTGGSTVKAAAYRLGDGDWIPMGASDGDFDEVSEAVTAGITAPDEAGVYPLCVRGEDELGNVSAESCTLLVVYDPTAGFVTGGGWIPSPPEACRVDACKRNPTGKASFGFVSKYIRIWTRNGWKYVPSGITQFKVGKLNFLSCVCQWLAVNDGKAIYSGTGTINGKGNYGFMLTAVDERLRPGADEDLFRMMIWDRNNHDEVVYDNEMGATEGADPTTAVLWGEIAIHQAR